MPVPVLDKTWQFNVNQWMPSAATPSNSSTGSTDNSRVWFAIKQSLVGFASNPWVVRYSCDGVTAGTTGDGVDRWTSAANISYAANYSWIVLAQAGLGGAQILFSFGAALAYSRVTAVLSTTAGFTGGTTTARPTAPDEVILTNADASWHMFSAADSASFNSWIHVMQSTDGQCTRVLLAGVRAETGGFLDANYPGGLILLERAKTPVAGWTAPIVAGIPRATTAGLYIDSLFRASPGGSTTDSQVVPLKGYHDGRTLNLAGAMDGYGVAGLTVGIGERRAARNDITGEWELAPITLTGEVTGRQNATGPGGRGRFGILHDLWYGGRLRLTGDTYPDDASRQLFHFGNLVLPWDGSRPRTVF